MLNHRQTSVRPRTRQGDGIWLALGVALSLHVGILLLPFNNHPPAPHNDSVAIEVQLTTFIPLQPKPLPDTVIPEPAIKPLPGPGTDLSKSITVAQPDKEPLSLVPDPQAKAIDEDTHIMDKQERRRLTDVILSSQFITEESATDKIFGKQLAGQNAEMKKEFHYPERKDMLAMLDQPMPELPFAYTPGLIHFAYDPGVKGDLQRFWDVITPEFGWRTNNGTEFRCVWILIVAGCGWK